MRMLVGVAMASAIAGCNSENTVPSAKDAFLAADASFSSCQGPPPTCLGSFADQLSRIQVSGKAASDMATLIRRTRDLAQAYTAAGSCGPSRQDEPVCIALQQADATWKAALASERADLGVGS